MICYLVPCSPSRLNGSLKLEFMFRDFLLGGVFDDHLPDGIGPGGYGEALPVADLLVSLLFEGRKLADGPVGAVGHLIENWFTRYGLGGFRRGDKIESARV